MANVEPYPNCFSTDIWFKRKESLDGNYMDYCEVSCEDCKYTMDMPINSPKTYDNARQIWNKHVFDETKKNLKHCPFCGSKDLRIEYAPEELSMNGGTIKEQAKYSVHCNKCNASTDDYSHMSIAIKHWNNRY